MNLLQTNHMRSRILSYCNNVREVMLPVQVHLVFFK